MDVSDLLRRLLHRRWAVGVVLLLALGAGLVGAMTSGTTQQSSAAVLIVPPPLGDAVSEQNPLLNLDNNLAQLATVLASAMQGTEVADALADENADGTFSISTVTGTNPSFAQLSPQLVFTVTAPDAATAERTSRALVEQARARLTALQTEASVPAEARAGLVQVVAPTAAEPSGNGRLRSAGAFGLVVLVVGLLGVLLADEALRRRGARTAAPADAAPAAAPAAPPAAAAAPAKTPAKTPAKAPAKAAKAPAKSTAGGGGGRAGADNRAVNGAKRSGGSRSRRSR